LTDFERFKVLVLRRRLSKLLRSKKGGKWSVSLFKFPTFTFLIYYYLYNFIRSSCFNLWKPKKNYTLKIEVNLKIQQHHSKALVFEEAIYLFGAVFDYQ
jgi:hypothetical protein